MFLSSVNQMLNIHGGSDSCLKRKSCVKSMRIAGVYQLPHF